MLPVPLGGPHGDLRLCWCCLEGSGRREVCVCVSFCVYVIACRKLVLFGGQWPPRGVCVRVCLSFCVFVIARRKLVLFGGQWPPRGVCVCVRVCLFVCMCLLAVRWCCLESSGRREVFCMCVCVPVCVLLAKR